MTQKLRILNVNCNNSNYTEKPIKSINLVLQIDVISDGDFSQYVDCNQIIINDICRDILCGKIKIE